MRYTYMREIHFARQWLDLRPLSVRFLSEGLFEPGSLIQTAAPDMCMLPGQPGALAPGLGDPIPVGPDIRAPLDALHDLESGRGPADPATRRLQALDEEWRRQLQRQRSRWQPRRSGPPQRAPTPMSRAAPLGPIGRGASMRGGAAALLASGVLAAHRHALVSELRGKLDGLGRQIRGLLRRSGFGQILCTAIYSFYTVADDIGNNDPRLAVLNVLTPPDLRGGRPGIYSAFDQFDFLYTGTGSDRAQASAAPHVQRTYGPMSVHTAPNRARAIGYLFAAL